MLKFLIRLFGRLKIMFGKCPECEDKMPDREVCYVCRGYRPYKLHPGGRHDRWERFKERHNL